MSVLAIEILYKVTLFVTDLRFFRAVKTEIVIFCNVKSCVHVGTFGEQVVNCTFKTGCSRMLEIALKSTWFNRDDTVS